MTLTYNRRDNHEHAWIDESGTAVLWRGATAWYGVIDNLSRKICAITWPDGDARILYLALVRINRERMLHGPHG